MATELVRKLWCLIGPSLLALPSWGVGGRTLKGSGVAESRIQAGPRFVKNPILNLTPNDTFLIRQGGPPSGYPSKGIITTPFKVVGRCSERTPVIILHIVYFNHTVYCNYSVCCILCILYCMLYILTILYIVNTVYTVYCVMCTVYCIFWF